MFRFSTKIPLVSCIFCNSATKTEKERHYILQHNFLGKYSALILETIVACCPLPTENVCKRHLYPELKAITINTFIIAMYFNDNVNERLHWMYTKSVFSLSIEFFAFVDKSFHSSFLMPKLKIHVKTNGWKSTLLGVLCCGQ